MKENKKRRVLIMYDGYKPAKTYGGPVNSIYNIVESLGDEIDFYIITSNHELKSKEKLKGIKEGWNRVGKANVIYLPNDQLKVRLLKKKIKEVNPNVIYLNSFFSYIFLFPTLSYKKHNKVKVILAPRGELCKNAIKIKAFKKKIYVQLLKILGIKNKIYWQATSQDEFNSIMRNLNVKSNRINFVEVLPKKISENINAVKKEKGKLKAVFISRITEKKNLIAAIQYVKKANNGISLDIYGFKEDMQYWNKCEKEIGTSNRVKYCGALDPDNVINTFSKYEIFLFPTYSENFGHVIAESMLGGCPVIISNQTPWNDVNDSKAGFAIELGNDKEFVKKLNEANAMNDIEFQELRNNCKKYIKDKINYEEISKKYKNMFINT